MTGQCSYGILYIVDGKSLSAMCSIERRTSK
nr:MAG TPA: hypothetical protein [Caudoviricetes sp.]